MDESVRTLENENSDRLVRESTDAVYSLNDDTMMLSR
jgi:hypothetical protein